MQGLLFAYVQLRQPPCAEQMALSMQPSACTPLLSVPAVNVGCLASSLCLLCRLLSDGVVKRVSKASQGMYTPLQCCVTRTNGLMSRSPLLLCPASTSQLRRCVAGAELKLPLLQEDGGTCFQRDQARSASKSLQAAVAKCHGDCASP